MPACCALIRASFVASHGIYGAPRVFLDLREAGETCRKHRVARLMREAQLRAVHGYEALGGRQAVGSDSESAATAIHGHAAQQGSLKKERIKKLIYKNRELAIAEVADYIEAFYNRTRRHSHLGGLSPEQFEAANVSAKSWELQSEWRNSPIINRQ